MNQKKIINKYVEMKKKLDKITKNINLDKNEPNDKENEYVYSDIDISVLISNPLMDIKDNQLKELKSMNDFHNITSAVYDVIRRSTKLVTAEFHILTQNNLIEAISLKPKIIHLICKSVYILPDPDKIEEKDKDKSLNSSNFVNLIFEDNNYCLAHFNW